MEICVLPHKQIQNSCLRKLNELLENIGRQFTETRKTIHNFFFKFSKEIETVEKIQTFFWSWRIQWMKWKLVKQRASMPEWIKQKKEYVNWKTVYLKLSTQKRRKKKDWKRMNKAYLIYGISLLEKTWGWWSPKEVRKKAEKILKK